MQDFTPLTQADGYGIVVGLGAAFAVGMVLTTFMLKRYQHEEMTAEEFATAGRSVKTGLILAAVVSSWTWLATLLTSCTMVYTKGISGSIYYAAGATCQIILFACIAIKGKQRSPNAHSYLEIIRARYGPVAHGVYIFWGLATNVLVTAMLLAGGSAVVKDFTGMNVVAACLLLPFGVVVYTLFGGIKATFLTDYVHTIFIIAIILVFAFTAFATSDVLGSPGKVWEIVTELAKTKPIDGNSEGSYLTMHSKLGGIFFVINIVGNFGTVFLDNGYFNKAFASQPAAALPGYVLGGLAWMAIPALVLVTMGLTALCLEGTPSWPIARPMTDLEVSLGLVLPQAATALLGKGGAYASLLLVFMAVTSAMSAELIAVSTIFTYDIYRGYIKPQAKGKELIFVSHATVIVFAYALAGFAIGLYYAGVSMGYLYELMGIIISGAVLPLVLTLLWKGQNKIAAIVTPPLATALAIVGWLVCTYKQEGTLTLETTFMDNPMLTGNVIALLSPAIISPVLTFVFGQQNFDWDILKQVLKAEEEPEEVAEVFDLEKVELKNEVSVVQTNLPDSGLVSSTLTAAEDEALLGRSFKKGVIICVTLTVCLVVLFPMPMYGTGYVFSKGFFTGWIVVFIIWMFFTSFMVIIYPIIEGRKVIASTCKGIWRDITGQTRKMRQKEALTHE